MRMRIGIARDKRGLCKRYTRERGGEVYIYMPSKKVLVKFPARKPIREKYCVGMYVYINIYVHPIGWFVGCYC